MLPAPGEQMLRTARSLEGFGISGLDGEIGRVHDLWFDGETWAVTAVIVKTPGWLRGRKVEVSPEWIEDVDDEAHTLRLDVTRAEVAGMPDAGLARALFGGEALSVPHGLSLSWLPGAAFAGAHVAVPAWSAGGGSGPVRSWHEVSGWTVQASDGRIGDVQDLVVDDRDWTVRAIEVDTGRFWRGPRVVVPLRMTERVLGGEAQIALRVPREAVHSAAASH